MNSAIESLEINSENCRPGSCFFAIVGEKHDGHDFIDRAIEKGATTVVCEKMPVKKYDNVNYILAENSAIALGKMADEFYGHPSQHLKIIGVTGTNGKTTTATLLYKILNAFHKKTGLISTAGIYINGIMEEAQNTTPNSIILNKLFARMIENGCEYAVMEVSSHSVIQHRIDGIKFTGAIYTNLTHDHLDYHLTLENYADAKKGFFDGLNKDAFAISNFDDEHGRFMVRDTIAKIYSYGFFGAYDFCEILKTKLLGRFNSYNALAVYGAAKILGFEESNIKKIMAELDAPKGRFELVYDKDNIKVIVDYAHTPDAVQNVLATAKECLKPGGRLICIIGCGGDRDISKRPVMASLAYGLSDILILTSDNPRSEDPDKILHDMKQGLPTDDETHYFVIPDREMAISHLPEILKSGDIALVLGKGHETYQEISGIRHHFDDKEEVIKAFENYTLALSTTTA